MEDPRVLHRRAGENAADVIARIPAERLGDPTRCPVRRGRPSFGTVAGG